MDFKPQHNTEPWYQAPAIIEHPGLGTIEVTATIFFTDLAKTPASWRPHVHFKFALEGKLEVSPPDYGTYPILEDAQAWCRFVIADESYRTLLAAIIEETRHRTRRFNGKLTPPQEDSHAQSEDRGS